MRVFREEPRGAAALAEEGRGARSASHARGAESRVPEEEEPRPDTPGEAFFSTIPDERTAFVTRRQFHRRVRVRAFLSDALSDDAMASYEELKARVAALKREDKDDSKARKAIAAREAAEVARCADAAPRRRAILARRRPSGGTSGIVPS